MRQKKPSQRVHSKETTAGNKEWRESESRHILGMPRSKKGVFLSASISLPCLLQKGGTSNKAQRRTQVKFKNRSPIRKTSLSCHAMLPSKPPLPLPPIHAPLFYHLWIHRHSVCLSTTMAPSQRRRAPSRRPSANDTLPLLLLLPSLLLLVCLPSPTHALDFQDIRDGFSGASDDIKKGMDGLHLPGMCA